MKALGIAVNDILTKTTFNSIDVFGAGAKITYGEDGAQSLTIAKAITTDTAILKGLTDAAIKGVAGSIATKADVAAALAEDPSRVIVLGAAIPPVFADPARVTVTAVENAISEINTQRATYGAQQNQLEHVVNNLGTTGENIQAAESRIRDVDMAKEMSEFTKANILVQAAQAMLAQANAQPRGVIQLLQA